MSTKMKQQIITIELTVVTHAGTTWSAEEINNMLKIKSCAPKDIKVLCHVAAEEQPV